MLHGLRYGDWKFLFKEQDKWFNGIAEQLTMRLIINLKLDPIEQFHDARGFAEWQESKSWTLGRATEQLGAFVKSLAEFPSRQKSIDMDMDAVMSQMYEASGR